MTSQEVMLVAIAALVIGVLVASTLQQLASWAIQTAGRLLLVAAILAVVWVLLVKPVPNGPAPESPPTESPLAASPAAWWE